MIQISITNAMRKRASKDGSDIKNKSKYDVENIHGLNEPDRYDNGMLGELAFKKYLDSRGYRYIWNEKHEKGDKYDFRLTLFMPDGSIALRTVDVKTGSSFDYKYLLVPTTQQLKCDLYVGVLVQDDEARIYGFAKKADLKPVKKVKTKVESVGKRLVDLTSLEVLEPYKN